MHDKAYENVNSPFNQCAEDLNPTIQGVRHKEPTGVDGHATGRAKTAQLITFQTQHGANGTQTLFADLLITVRLDGGSWRWWIDGWIDGDWWGEMDRFESFNDLIFSGIMHQHFKKLSETHSMGKCDDKPWWYIYIKW